MNNNRTLVHIQQSDENIYFKQICNNKKKLAREHNNRIIEDSRDTQKYLYM